MSSRKSSARARTLIRGGVVLPCDGRTAPQEALVIDKGRIVASGSEGDMRSLAGKKAQHVDVQGATVMPGIVDTHPHVMHLQAPYHWMVDLRGVKNHDEIVALIRARARKTKAGEWIVCTPIGEPFYFIRRSHYDLEERRMPDRWILDGATDRHPVIIMAMSPKMPNVCAFNSLGLHRVGIGSAVPDRVGNVWIEKQDESGLPTGVLHGQVLDYLNPDPFWNQIRQQLPVPPDDFWIEGARYGMPVYNKMGVTSIYEGHLMAVEHIEAYKQLRANEELSLRVLAALELSNRPLYTQADPGADGGDPLTKCLHTGLKLTRDDASNEFMQVNGVTLGRSGSSSAGMARTYDPYTPPFGQATFGKELVPRSAEQQAIKFCLEHDLRLNLTLLTPKDHDDFFKSLDPHMKKYDIRERGWIIQHSPTITPAQIKRHARIGTRFTMSTSFTWGKAHVWASCMGKQILRDFNPLKRMFDAGIPVGNGTDWGPHNIFEHLVFSETHEMGQTGLRNNGPDQVLTREQALMMWTRDAARSLSWKGVGTLEPGNHADVIFVDRNPLTTSLDDLPATRVLRTILGGKTVYDDGELS